MVFVWASYLVRNTGNVSDADFFKLERNYVPVRR